jgi:nucleoside-diphosphate-sugar epimerase
VARTIYILGASGFLGSCLHKHFLAAGDKVIGISHKGRQPPVLEPGAIIINCSARYMPDADWEAMLQGNYHFAKSVLLQCDATHKIINFGSYFEYGEDGSTGPINNYAIAKRLLRGWLEDQGRAGRFRALTFILYDVIGPGDPRPKLVPMLSRAQPGETIELTACEQTIDLVPIEIVLQHVEAYLSLASPPFGPLAISGGSPQPLRWFVELLRQRRGFLPVYGSKPYAPTQIFRPVSNLPALDLPPKVTIDASYLDALCA